MGDLYLIRVCLHCFGGSFPNNNILLQAFRTGTIWAEVMNQPRCSNRFHLTTGQEVGLVDLFQYKSRLRFLVT